MASDFLSLADACQDAYRRHWSYSNTFSVSIQFSEMVRSELKWSNDNNTKFNLNVVNISTPQLNASPIEIFVADRWKIAQGRPELFRFTLSIRDEDNLKYFRMFSKAFWLQQKNYYDDCKTTVTITKLPDYANEKAMEIIELKGCLIESVSNVTFDNTSDASIVQFTVNFKCPLPVSGEVD